MALIAAVILITFFYAAAEHRQFVASVEQGDKFLGFVRFTAL